MVYTRILFNNIKEGTPYFMKTVAYNQTVKPLLGRRSQIAWKMTRDPKYIKMMRWVGRNIMAKTLNYQIFFFIVTYSITSAFFYPSLWMYQSNNRHRQLDYAIQKENQYKEKKALEEATEEEEEGAVAGEQEDEE